MPPVAGGAAHLIISALFPSGYAEAEAVFRAFMVRAALLSLACPSEDLLIAAGESQVILIGNVLRAIWTVAGSLIGYYCFGFIGFIYGMALSGLPPLTYYYWLQNEKGFLIPRYELYKVGFITIVAIMAYFGSSVVWKIVLAMGLRR